MVQVNFNHANRRTISKDLDDDLFGHAIETSI